MAVITRRAVAESTRATNESREVTKMNITNRCRSHDDVKLFREEDEHSNDTTARLWPRDEI